MHSVFLMFSYIVLERVGDLLYGSNPQHFGFEVCVVQCVQATTCQQLGCYQPISFLFLTDFFYDLRSAKLGRQLCSTCSVYDNANRME